MNPWRAGCGESRTSGSEGGPEKPTSRKAGTALRPDPYTYLRTGEGWLYLATVIDLFSRRVIGWSLAEHLRTSLVADALQTAIATRGGHVAGVIFHSDRGCPVHLGRVRRAVRPPQRRAVDGRHRGLLRRRCRRVLPSHATQESVASNGWRASQATSVAA